MTTLTNLPIGDNITGIVRAGDPEPQAGNPRLVALAYPYPQGPTPTWLSVDAAGTIRASPTIGPNELFQESTPKGFLECERAGPLQFGIAYGYF